MGQFVLPLKCIMKLFFKYLFLILSVSIMVIIFIFSAQTAEVSSNESGSLISEIVKIIMPNFKNLTELEQQAIINSLQTFVRKSAHFLIYASLGFCVCGFFISIVQKSLGRFACSLPICFVYAVSDEIHQLFVEGRACQISDILLDTVGAAFGILLIIFILYIIKSFRRKHNEIPQKQ